MPQTTNHTAANAAALALVTLALAGLAGCAEHEEHHGARLHTSAQPTLIKDLERMSGDYPAELIDGLSKQLVDEVNCIQPGVLVSFEVRQDPGYLYTTNYIPHMLRPEVLAAAKAVAAGQNDFMTITSAYRDVGMQYYDWLWGQRLGFMAARPGSSRHQAGQAIDVLSNTYWRPFLLDYGWQWPYGTDDAPHFEWVQNSTPDLMVESVRAFQRLWNRNTPADLIAEDGAWGPATEARMDVTQAYGFPYGGCDLDLDGYAATIIGGDDCDDDASHIHPGATEICSDAVDQDCSGADLICGEDPGPSDTAQPDTALPDTWTADTTGSDTFIPPDTSSTDTALSPDSSSGTDTGPLADVPTSGEHEAFAAWQQAPVDGMQTETACGCRSTRSPRAGGAATWLLTLAAVGLMARRRRSGRWRNP